MRSILFATLVLALGAGGPAVAAPGIVSKNSADMPAGEWRLDPGHASITVKLSHLGFSMFTLRFDKIQASIAYDPAAPEKAKVTAQVDPNSVNTGQPALDRELMQEAWFDAAHAREISFTSRSIVSEDGHKGRMTGDLTMRGVTRAVTFDVTFNGTGTGFGPPMPRAGFSASAIVHKSDFGMTKYAGLLGDDVQILVEAEFTKATPSGGVPK